MELKVLLVDDEPAALERLSALFAQIPDTRLVGVARNGREAGQAIAELAPDLVMLDIQMPELSGLALASELPVETRPEIVFVTAFEVYAADAFAVEAADYLLKPVRFDRLRQAVERARRRRTLQKAFEQAEAAPIRDNDLDGIWVATRQGHVRVAVSEIDWIEAAKDYVLLHTATRSHIHRITMSALEQALDPARMIRVHRSAFVSPDRVEAVNRLGKGLIALVLRDGVAVPVGPTYVKAVQARLGLGCLEEV
ncbi:LytR/AlgR family response regulator transcription factor [Caulobacter segnis]|jgi:DNA-binding LytR/AlgR family response regulator|uniref:LytR/AlgR family response regulator transcription factor n=1 Tax=Caulobacter segnis TaxID=88688 RepID=UPI001CBDA7F7|nr:LytTR family DNA-binding domain-containing protein [Caulobacter segnis]UAL09484.1 LytTR family DNA-binding domain-containing protein [Caulobacter segnis]